MRGFLNEKAANLKQGAIRAMFDRMLGKENIISLAIGEPDFFTHPDIIDAAYKAFQAGHTHYTPNAGYLELRRAIAKAPVTDKLGYDPQDEIIVTTGAMGALSLVFMVVLSPGDEVILQDPVWLNYYTLIGYPGGVPVGVRTDSADGFKLHARDIEKKITPRTKAILLNNPSNPTGAFLTADEMREIAELAVKYDLLVISDDVYNTLIYDGQQPFSIAEFPGMRERTVVINSFSKAFAMTGWRVGYAMGPSAIIRKMVLLQENMVSCVSAVAQEAARYALTRLDIAREMAKVYEEKRNFIYDGLLKIEGVKCVKPGGAFYIFPDISEINPDADAFCIDLMDKTGVVCVPGNAFGEAGKGHIRISYANSKENLRMALERIDDYVKKWC